MITNIRTLRELVLKTNYYKKLTTNQKDILLKRNNLIQIEHGLNLIKNIGFEKLEKEHNFSYANKEIIKELF